MRPRVVILGGGFTGMRALVRLHAELGQAVQLTLIDRAEESLMTPLVVDAAFGREEMSPLRFRFADAARDRGEFIRGNAFEIEFAAQTIQLTDGARVGYDHLFIALGAERDFDSVPGLATHATLLWNAETALETRHALDAYRGGPIVVLDAPSVFGTAQELQPHQWSALEAAATEAAFCADGHLRNARMRDRGHVERVTPGPYLATAAGPAVRAIIDAECVARGVDVHVEAAVARVEADAVVLTDGSRIASALTIALPPYRGARALAGSPIVDDAGYVVVDPATFRAPLYPEVVCAGDACALTQPKLGHLAAIQADVAIASVVEAVTGEPSSAHYEPEVMYLMAPGGATSQLVYSDVLFGGTDDFVLRADSVEFMRFMMSAWYHITDDVTPALAKEATRRYVAQLERRHFV